MTTETPVQKSAAAADDAGAVYADIREKRDGARQAMKDAGTRIKELETRLRQGDLTVKPSDLTEAEAALRHAELSAEAHDAAARKARVEHARARYAHLEHKRAVDTDAAAAVLDEAVPAAVEYLAKAFAAIGHAHAGNAAHESAVSELAAQSDHTLPHGSYSNRPDGSPNWDNLYLDDLMVEVYKAAIDKSGFTKQEVAPYQSSLAHVTGLNLLSPRLTKPVPAVAHAVAANGKTKGA